MKKIILILLVVASLLVVACTTPNDVPSATVDDTYKTPDIMQDDPDANNGNQDFDVISYNGEVAVDKTLSTFEFEGYTVGKSHIGTFDTWDAFLVYDTTSNLVGGSGIIQADSVNTGIEGLDTHLKNDDFFDTQTYPEIAVDFLHVEETQITADLTFRGVTKTITFPATLDAQGVKADFLLDTTDFDMKYTGVDKQVRIAFAFYPAP